jgi:hypothetical protein
MDILLNTQETSLFTHLKSVLISKLEEEIQEKLLSALKLIPYK